MPTALVAVVAVISDFHLQGVGVRHHPAEIILSGLTGTLGERLHRVEHQVRRPKLPEEVRGDATFRVLDGVMEDGNHLVHFVVETRGHSERVGQVGLRLPTLVALAVVGDGRHQDRVVKRESSDGSMAPTRGVSKRMTPPLVVGHSLARHGCDPGRAAGVEALSPGRPRPRAGGATTW